MLRSWSAPPGQELIRQDYLAFLDTHPGAVWRDSGPEHLTASALLLDADRTHALLTLHGKGGFWAQLGGHLEPQDSSLAAGALREATEESGIAGVELLAAGGPVRLDRHELSSAFGTCRAHRDVQYLAVAPPGAQPVLSAESRALRWFALADLVDGRLCSARVDGGAFVDVRGLAAAALDVVARDRTWSAGDLRPSRRR